MTAIDRLNELLEAERAGVDTLSRLFPEARGPEMQKLFEAVRDDEAWSCAGLVRSIKTLGGTISEKKGDFAEKVMREPTLAARLRLLNRGQGWVVKRLDGLLGETLPGVGREFSRRDEDAPPQQHRSLRAIGGVSRLPAADELKSWRKAERDRLIAARESSRPGDARASRQRIDAHLWRSFPGLAAAKLAFCWPIRGEYDARRLAQRLRERGAVTALPVVVAPRQPLVFREWHPGVTLASGPLGIPYPVGSDPVVPTAVLVPMNGWDEAGYRLGYGGGFFDRTLASLAKKPVVIGVSYELARLKTIRPQSWDIPMDWVVTERGIYRRDPEGLVFLGEPVAGIDQRTIRP